MQHTKIMALLKVLPNINPNMSDKDLAVTVGRIADLPVLPDDLYYIQSVSEQPSTKHMVHALNDLGFNRSYTKDLLGITDATISYHLQEQPKKLYINTALQTIQELPEDEAMDRWQRLKFI